MLVLGSKLGKFEQMNISLYLHNRHKISFFLQERPIPNSIKWHFFDSTNSLMSICFICYVFFTNKNNITRKNKNK